MFFGGIKLGGGVGVGTVPQNKGVWVDMIFYMLYLISKYHSFTLNLHKKTFHIFDIIVILQKTGSNGAKWDEKLLRIQKTEYSAFNFLFPNTDIVLSSELQQCNILIQNEMMMTR